MESDVIERCTAAGVRPLIAEAILSVLRPGDVLPNGCVVAEAVGAIEAERDRLRAEVERLRAENDERTTGRDATLISALKENSRLRAEVERLREVLSGLLKTIDAPGYILREQQAIEGIGGDTPLSRARAALAEKGDGE